LDLHRLKPSRTPNTPKDVKNGNGSDIMTLRIFQSFSMNHFQFIGNPNSIYLASSHRRTMTESSLFLCGFIFIFALSSCYSQLLGMI